MAKLYSYYTLCPLIDQQNLLGVERDSESGCAIVTLGRNIVIRYKLQDLKQLSSWTSKDRLTAQVIYDETTHQYAAIFNEKKIRLWSAEETDLNNIKGSHGRLYSHPLTETNTETSLSTLIGIISNINTKYPVVMTCLNEATVAVYGADVSEEGAVLMIYNVQFKLIQDAQKLKLYTNDAKLWKIEDKLLLAANKHLAIAPYHLAAQKIATLLGSSLRFKSDNENAEDEIVVIQESTVAQWEKNGATFVNQLSQNPPIHLSKQISSYLKEGLSDAAIQEIVIPQLIESKDVDGIIWCLNNIKDLPEKLLIDLLIFSLRSPDETFLPLQNVSHLKSGLNFDEILRLLKYLIQKLDDQELFHDIVQQPADKQLYEWSSLLLESHYQQYILSRDPQVSTLLNKLNYVLDDHLQVFKDMENLRPILKRTIHGKSSKLLQKNCNKFYTIEEIKLY
ncbi:Nucleolar protein 11-like [Habropoda laboriosa]|uniref:Nucleolar protein 11-like n=1 Tax=Habropoda laboriosa TaxID=597456 RepID=A0A0L7RD35_9HYME|nr:Nucleolar protein 11-like [Habropoda laboriosa]